MTNPFYPDDEPTLFGGLSRLFGEAPKDFDVTKAAIEMRKKSIPQMPQAQPTPDSIALEAMNLARGGQPLIAPKPETTTAMPATDIWQEMRPYTSAFAEEAKNLPSALPQMPVGIAMDLLKTLQTLANATSQPPQLFGEKAVMQRQPQGFAELSNRLDQLAPADTLQKRILRRTGGTLEGLVETAAGLRAAGKAIPFGDVVASNLPTFAKAATHELGQWGLYDYTRRAFENYANGETLVPATMSAVGRTPREVAGNLARVGANALDNPTYQALHPIIAIPAVAAALYAIDTKLLGYDKASTFQDIAMSVLANLTNMKKTPKAQADEVSKTYKKQTGEELPKETVAAMRIMADKPITDGKTLEQYVSETIKSGEAYKVAINSGMKHGEAKNFLTNIYNWVGKAAKQAASGKRLGMGMGGIGGGEETSDMFGAPKAEPEQIDATDLFSKGQQEQTKAAKEAMADSFKKASTQGQMDLTTSENKKSDIEVAEETLKSLPNYKPPEYPVDKIILSPSVEQFKEETAKLEGRYDRTVPNPVVLWDKDVSEPNNPVKEIITGRGRLSLAQRTGEKTIPAYFVKESEGWDEAKASLLDVIKNAQDNTGRIKDYAIYFRKTGVNPEEAKASGVLRESSKSQAGWVMARDLTDVAFKAVEGNQITEEQGLAIAKAAPQDTKAQLYGVRLAQSGQRPDVIENTLKYKPVINKSGGEQTTIFETDAEWEENALRVGKAVTQEIARLNKELSATKALTQRGKDAIAESKGVDVKDKEFLKKDRAMLEKKIDDWRHFSTRNMFGEARKLAGIEEKPEPPAAIAPQAEAAPPKPVQATPPEAVKPIAPEPIAEPPKVAEPAAPKVEPQPEPPKPPSKEAKAKAKAIVEQNISPASKKNIENAKTPEGKERAIDAAASQIVAKASKNAADERWREYGDYEKKGSEAYLNLKKQEAQGKAERMEQFKKDVRAALSDLYLPPRTPEENLKREMVDEATQGVDQVSVAPQKKTLAELAAEKNPPNYTKSEVDDVAAQVRLAAKRTDPNFRINEELTDAEIIRADKDARRIAEENMEKRRANKTTDVAREMVDAGVPKETADAIAPKRTTARPSSILKHQSEIFKKSSDEDSPISTIDDMNEGQYPPDKDAADYVKTAYDNLERNVNPEHRGGIWFHKEVPTQLIDSAYKKLKPQEAQEFAEDIETLENAVSLVSKTQNETSENLKKAMGRHKFEDLPNDKEQTLRDYFEGKNDGGDLPKWAKDAADVLIKYDNEIGKYVNVASRLLDYVKYGKSNNFTDAQKAAADAIKKGYDGDDITLLDTITDYSKTDEAQKLFSVENYLTRTANPDYDEADAYDTIVGTLEKPSISANSLKTRVSENAKPTDKNPFSVLIRHYSGQLHRYLVMPHASRVLQTIVDKELLTPSSTKTAIGWIRRNMGMSEQSSFVSKLAGRAVGGIYRVFSIPIGIKNLFGGQFGGSIAETSSIKQAIKNIAHRMTTINPNKQINELPQKLKSAFMTTDGQPGEMLMSLNIPRESAKDFPPVLREIIGAWDWSKGKFPPYDWTLELFGKKLIGIEEKVIRFGNINSLYQNASDVLLKQNIPFKEALKKLNTGGMDKYEMLEFARLIAEGNRDGAAYYYARQMNRRINYRYASSHWGHSKEAAPYLGLMKYMFGTFNKFSLYAKNVATFESRGNRIGALRALGGAMAFAAALDIFFNSTPFGNKEELKDDLKKDGMLKTFAKRMFTSEFGAGQVISVPMRMLRGFGTKGETPSAALRSFSNIARAGVAAYDVIESRTLGKSQKEINDKIAAFAKAANEVPRNLLPYWKYLEIGMASVFGKSEVNLIKSVMAKVLNRNLGKEKPRKWNAGDFARGAFMVKFPPKPKTNAGATPPAQSKESEPFNLDDNLDIGNLDLKF